MKTIFLKREGRDSKAMVLRNQHDNASRAFTLIEIVLALMILAIILSIAVPSLSSYFTEQKLRTSMRQFEGILQDARHRAMTTQHPHRLHFTEKSVELYDATIPEKTKPDPVSSETWLSGIQFREKINETPVRYTLPDDWTITTQGLCDPLRFRLTFNRSWMEFSLHPLDGSIQNLEFKLDENDR